MIIRFKQITQIKSIEVHVLDEVINPLSESGIRIYLYDVDANIENQFIKFDLLRRIGENKIFPKIDDASECARNELYVC
jgi:MFS superfamily sulfate permease-like transporter